jgi:hypothetical protein
MIHGPEIFVLNKMPLYQVRKMDRQIIKVFEAVTPSKAAIKAFNCQRRKETGLTEFHCMVYTEGKKFMTEYHVSLEAIDPTSATEHEKKFRIQNRTIAKKVSQDPW